MPRLRPRVDRWRAELVDDVLAVFRMRAARTSPANLPQPRGIAVSGLRVRRKKLERDGRTRCDRCGGRRVLVVGERTVPCPRCNDHEPNAAWVLKNADLRYLNFDPLSARRAA
jgi:hypothetical protein